MAGFRRQRSNGYSKKKVYSASDCILISERESGNAYAVGLSNLVAAHALAVPLAVLLNDSNKAGRLMFDLGAYYVVFGSLWEWFAVAGILFAEFLLSFLVYFFFLVWATCYRRFGSTVSVIFLLLLVVCVFVSRRIVFVTVFDLGLHTAGRLTCCIQQVILCMKWVAFIHENAYKVLYPWHKDDETGPAVWYEGQMEPQIGSFSSYVYFLFCPVLLYRDRYPRKPRNFYKAAKYFIQFFVSPIVAFIIFKEFLVPSSMQAGDLVTSLVRCMFLGFLQLCLAHTCVMHGWMNMWAELLGFADCSFYQDWWNGRSLGEYLGKWNPVIHEWLRDYVFFHLKRYLPRTVAMLLILVLSAAEHDFLISTGFGFFMPMYIIEYGIGGFLFSFKPSFGEKTDRLVMAVGLTFGSGVQIAIYCTEVAARIHCQAYEQLSWSTELWTMECYRRFNN